MKISKINKMILIAGAIFVLTTVLVAFYLRPKGQIPIVQDVYSVSDYEIIEGDSQNTVQSKEAGFSLSAPKDWIIRKLGDKISFYSSEIELEQAEDVAEMMEESNICSASVEIRKYNKADHVDILALNTLISQVESGEKGQDRDYAYSLDNINGRVFLKITFTREGEVIYVSTKTLNNNIIYFIDSGLIFSKECEQSFNNIFQSISIDYNK